MIRAVVADDEAPARARICRMLADLDGILVVGEAANGEAAVRAVETLRPDVLFLDVEMPERNGLQVAAALAPPRPRLIFCTPYDHYAIEAFEHHAVDYLLKPLQRDRLERTIGRLREGIEEQQRHRR